MPKGIYAEGIIESSQAQGENINIYPEVTGPITEVLVSEGAHVHKGDALLAIDDSVQRATAEQQQSQAEAARALLAELKAEPRRENLDVAAAQVDNAQATLKNAQDQLEKQEHSYAIEPKSVSRDALDNARNAEKIATTNLEVVDKQYALTKAGAWIYDIRTRKSSMSPSPKPTHLPPRCWPNTPSGRRRTGSCARFRRPSAATCPRKAPMTATRRAWIR